MSKKPDPETVAEPTSAEAEDVIAPAVDEEEPKAGKASRKSKKKSAKASASEPKPPTGSAEGASARANSDPDEESASVLKDRLLRLQADFDNFRKRTLRERDDLYRMANEDLVTDLLPVMDNFQLALMAAGEDAQSKAMAEGVKLVSDQLMAALKKYNLVALDAVGEVFDPNMHEALSQAPSAEFKEQLVMFQHRCGYRLGNKLLRPAQVIVSLGPGPDEDSADSEDETAGADNGASVLADAPKED